MSAPRISVLMTVYNGEAFLRQAVASILNQTFSDFELVLVDDGSDDATPAILREFEDRRLLVLPGEHAGLTVALNRGGAACRGEYIARMDADDIAAPERLQVEFNYLTAHRKMGLVCSDAHLINEVGARIGLHRMGRWDDKLLREALMFRARAMPIIHPSVMMRREVFQSLGGYRDFLCAEDHDFWLRALEDFRFGHCARPLLYYRVHQKSISRARRATQAAYGLMSVVAHLARPPAHMNLIVHRPKLFEQFLSIAKAWVQEHLLPRENAFLGVRSHIKETRYLAASAALAHGLIQHGFELTPSRRNASLRRFSERLADKLSKELALGGADGFSQAPFDEVGN